MKKYIQPNMVICQREFFLMEGLSMNNVPGNQNDFFTNETVFDDTEDINPQNDKSFWDDAE